MTTQEFKTAVKEIHKKLSLLNYTSDEGKELMQKEYQLKVIFAAEHGTQAIVDAFHPKTGRTSKAKNNRFSRNEY